MYLFHTFVDIYAAAAPEGTKYSLIRNMAREMTAHMTVKIYEAIL